MCAATLFCFPSTRKRLRQQKVGQCSGLNSGANGLDSPGAKGGDQGGVTTRRLLEQRRVVRVAGASRPF